MEGQNVPDLANMDTLRTILRMEGQNVPDSEQMDVN